MQITENLLGQADRSKRHGHRVFTNGGVGAYLLGGIERGLEQAPQQRADGSCLARYGVGGLHLAEDLRFTQHQRIETGRHTHHVTNCRILFMHISAGTQVIEAQMVKIGQPAQHYIR